MAWRIAWILCLLVALAIPSSALGEPLEISGRYPHLAMHNSGGECGTGAVAAWAGRLWVITYAPHCPNGSDDKLYEIDANLVRTTRPESVGGTPAGRMIHRESGQLIIGPYLIDEAGRVRAVAPSAMPGRLTAVARHLTDPAGKVYVYDMEGRLYELDVRTLAPVLLFEKPIPGWHGKGGYTSQGRLVLANNGESAARKFAKPPYQAGSDSRQPGQAGALAQWDGKTWGIVERQQFTEVTGTGGILGAADGNSPLWAVGFDRRSVILKLLDGGTWHTFRMPKADYSYDGEHGWHTEWPRIRQVADTAGGKPVKLLMNMHGGWFDFPITFSAGDASGLRPIGDYLKVTGDFAPWRGRIVFGCDDAAASGFSASKGFDGLNSLVGRSNSNLWFATWEALSQAGRPAGAGGPWVTDDVKAGEPSSPYLLAGYRDRVLHIWHAGKQAVTFTIETGDGRGKWATAGSVAVPAGGYAFHVFPPDAPGQWVRLTADRDAPGVTAYFLYGPGGGATEDRGLFAALADIDSQGPWSGGVMRSEAGGDGQEIPLGALTVDVDAAGRAGEEKTWQVGPDLQFSPTAPDSASAKVLKTKARTAAPAVEFDAASAILIAGGKRYRLPASAGYDKPWPTGWPRMAREVVTERTLLNVAGSFYVMPRTNSGGLARIKPICTHNKRITDFCSWRGLLVMSGCRADAKPDGHYFQPPDGAAGLWFGDIDDLWKMGKPRGAGGPWRETPVQAGKPSDPYLMAGYDRKTLAIYHDSAETVTFTIEVDILGNGTWVRYAAIDAPAGRETTHAFPPGYAAHWGRLSAGGTCKATAVFTYE